MRWLVWVGAAVLLVSGCALGTTKDESRREGQAESSSAPTRSTTTSSREASPTSSAKPLPFTRLDRPSKADVTISRYLANRPMWAGDWSFDLTGVRLQNGPEYMVVSLTFADLPRHLEPQKSWRIPTRDMFSAYFSNDRGGRWSSVDREAFFAWGARGGLVTPMGGLMCRFEPRLNRETNALVMRIPRDCFPGLEQARVRADFDSIRKMAGKTWEAVDVTGWTAFAGPGQTVSLGDPHG